MLSFPTRLPDCIQVQALRLLDVSRPAINQFIQDLWLQLDAIAGDRAGLAWKQVEHDPGAAAAKSDVRWSRRAGSYVPRPPTSRSFLPFCLC